MKLLSGGLVVSHQILMGYDALLAEDVIGGFGHFDQRLDIVESRMKHHLFAPWL